MSEHTNVEAGVVAVMDGWPPTERTREFVRAALAAIDPRLADLTPEETTAIFDIATLAYIGDHPEATFSQSILKSLSRYEKRPSVPAHAWEVLSR